MQTALSSLVARNGRRSLFDRSNPLFAGACGRTNQPSPQDFIDPAVYIELEDLPLAYVNASGKIMKIRNHMKTLSGLLNSFENVGHKEAPEMDGLNVTLHDYQKQAVGWMLDRENGNNAHQIWAKLPKMKGVSSKEDIWFCPMIGRFARGTPPSMGRGGFLCEEMGLGKTVISLSVILQNPAPALPPSGIDVPADGVSFVAPNGWSQVPPREVSKRREEGDIGRFSDDIYSVVLNLLCCDWHDRRSALCVNPGPPEGRQ